MRPRQITILGVGLVGGSLGLAVRRISDCKIIGYGHRTKTLDKAKALGAIDKGYDNPADSVRGSDLIVLCTPVGVFEEILQTIGPHLSAGAVVTDVGSTKRVVTEAADRARIRFVGSHPMAGSEKRGVEFARADLFDRALCILTPTDRTDADALSQVDAFWKSIGMRTTQMSPIEHDRRLAEVSHLPHAVAAAVVGIQEEASLPLAGKGFLDATRIAAGDAGLWCDILLENRDNVLKGLERLETSFHHLSAALKRGDADAIRQWLADAAQRRAKMG